MIKQLIRMNHTKNILEIGTAIGYSSMQFSSVANDTCNYIERNEDMIALARNYFHQYGYNEQIRLIEGNALETYQQVNDDMIFIDAAKAQSKKFFELYTPLLRKGGISN